MADSIEKQWEDLQAKRNSLLQAKTKIETILDAKKKDLREAIQECKDAGYNPDTLANDIKKAEEVCSLKLENYKADLDAAEKILTPMIESIS